METKEMRFNIALQTMLKLMEWEYYRDYTQDGQGGLLSNRKSICAAARLYADTLLHELEKNN